MAARHTFEGTILTRSAKALLFWGHFWHAPMWIPMSQSTVEEDDDSHVITISGWLSKKNDLVEFTEYTEEQMRARNPE